MFVCCIHKQIFCITLLYQYNLLSKTQLPAFLIVCVFVKSAAGNQLSYISLSALDYHLTANPGYLICCCTIISNEQIFCHPLNNGIPFFGSLSNYQKPIDNIFGVDNLFGNLMHQYFAQKPSNNSQLFRFPSIFFNNRSLSSSAPFICSLSFSFEH